MQINAKRQRYRILKNCTCAIYFQFRSFAILVQLDGVVFANAGAAGAGQGNSKRAKPPGAGKTASAPDAIGSGEKKMADHKLDVMEHIIKLLGPGPEQISVALRSLAVEALTHSTKRDPRLLSLVTKTEIIQLCGMNMTLTSALRYLTIF